MVSTGGCPSGCAPGYTGEDCYTRKDQIEAPLTAKQIPNRCRYCLLNFLGTSQTEAKIAMVIPVREIGFTMSKTWE